MIQLYKKNNNNNKHSHHTSILSFQSLSHTNKCLQAHPPLIYVSTLLSQMTQWAVCLVLVWVEELSEMLIAGLWEWHRGTSERHSQWPLKRSTQRLVKSYLQTRLCRVCNLHLACNRSGSREKTRLPNLPDFKLFFNCQSSRCGV